MSYADLERDFTGHLDSESEPVMPLVRRRDSSPWSQPRPTFDDAYWDRLLDDDDEQAASEWKRRRPRRVAVRMLGWAALAGVIWGAVFMTGFAPARRAILEWGTLGSIQAGSVP